MTCLTCDDSLGDIDAEDAWHSDMAVAVSSKVLPDTVAGSVVDVIKACMN